MLSRFALMVQVAFLDGQFLDHVPPNPLLAPVTMIIFSLHIALCTLQTKI